MQLDLFDSNEAKLGPLPKGMKCGNCTHMYRHNYNKEYKYCRKQSQPKTAYGHKKIKAGDRACPLFELKIK